MYLYLTALPQIFVFYMYTASSIEGEPYIIIRSIILYCVDVVILYFICGSTHGILCIIYNLEIYTDAWTRTMSLGYILSMLLLIFSYQIACPSDICV